MIRIVAFYDKHRLLKTYSNLVVMGNQSLVKLSARLDEVYFSHVEEYTQLCLIGPFTGKIVEYFLNKTYVNTL